MNERRTTSAGWFADVDPADRKAATAAIRERTVEEPREWAAEAVDAGFADDEDDYYDALHEATMAATRAGVTERERADDRQLVHAVRAMDDIGRILL